MPINPEIRMAIVWPRIAPKTPKPETTRVIIKVVLIIDWTNNVVLWYCAFSQAVKADWVAFKRACAKIVKEAIWIIKVICGLLKMFVARRSERKYDVKDSITPIRISKTSAAVRIFFILLGLFSCLYWGGQLWGNGS